MGGSRMPGQTRRLCAGRRKRTLGYRPPAPQTIALNNALGLTLRTAYGKAGDTTPLI